MERLGILLAAVLAICLAGSSHAALPELLKDRPHSALAELERSEGTLYARFDMARSVELKETLHALWLDDPDPEAYPAIYLNGRRVDYAPVALGDGFLLRLPPDGVLPRGNLLAVTGSSATRALLFPLLDGFEETHFEMAFAEPGAMEKAAPPLHPNQHLYEVQHYYLELQPNMNNTFVQGRLTMEAKALTDGLSQLVLDFDQNGGQMGVVSVDGGPGTDPLTYTLNQGNSWLLINLPEPVQEGGTATVRVQYQGFPETSGRWGAAYRRGTHGASNTPVVYTFSQPYGARKWWPCKDIPGEKATMELSIRVPKPHHAMSIGNLMEIEDDGTHRIFHWKTDHPVATYLVSVAASTYVSGSVTYTGLDGETTMDISHYVYPHNEDELQGLAGTLDIMEYFAELFGEYPFLDEKYVNVTHNSGSGMEHQTASSMPPRNLFPDGKHRRNVHEVGHHWFGNLVTCETFDHIWLNEGWATYMEALYYEYDLGEQAYHDYVQGWISTGITDTLPMVSTDADAFILGLVYRKGGLVLHMLRKVMGDEDFFQAARNYLQANAYGTVVTEDLIHHYEQVYGEPLDWFFDQWVYGTGKPRYEWSWALDDEEETLSLNIRQTHSGPAFTMPIEIRLTALDGTTQTHTVFNDQADQTFDLAVGDLDPFEVELDPDNWIYKDTGSGTDAPRMDGARILPGGQILVSWRVLSGNPAGFQLIESSDLENWRLVADSGTLGSAAREATLPAPPPGDVRYYQIRAVSGAGFPSALSNIYGVRRPADEQVVLVVDGYERWFTQGRGPNHPFAAWHGEAIHEHGAAFDTVSNLAILDATVTLSDYDAVVWMLGEESTQDETFSSEEQDLVRQYLRGGGQIFVSGAEIAWDLDWRGSSADRAFYADFLKASYIADDSGGEHDVSGAPGSIFEGEDFWFDDGSAGIYFVRWPDVINPESGGTAALQYPTAGPAAVQFEGTFPGGTAPGRLVNMGFPLETVHPPADRNRLLSIALDFFEIAEESLLPGDMLLVH